MIIWEENGTAIPGHGLRTAFGQTEAGVPNRNLWLRDVHTITVSVVPPPAPPPVEEEEPDEIPIPELPRDVVEATPATPEQVVAAQDAVNTAAGAAESNNISIVAAGPPVNVSAGESPTITNIPNIEAEGATVLAILNDDGTLTPVMTVINEDGTMTALISGDVTLVPLAVEADFNDVEGHWAEEAINRAASLMLVEGTGGGSYSPAAEVTGGQAVTLFMRMLAMSVDADAPPVDGIDQDAWFAGAVNTGVQNGLMPDVDPSEPMSRLQMAELISNALRIVGRKPDMSVEQAKEILAGFTDMEHLTDEQIVFMGILVQIGIFQGNGDGTMAPDAVLRRSHLATLALRVQDYIMG
jgi:hypothetical protein